MSTLGWIILAIVVVVVVVLLVFILRSLRGRRLRQRESHAAELRHAARTKAPDIATSRQQASDAEAQAAAARAQAERAEQEAATARDALAHDEAKQEDLLREADRVDPTVDHRAADYRPTPPATGGTHAAPVTDETTTGETTTGARVEPETDQNGGAHASRT